MQVMSSLGENAVMARQIWGRTLVAVELASHQGMSQGQMRD